MYAWFAAMVLGLMPTPIRLAELIKEAHEKNPESRAAVQRARAATLAVSPAGALEDPMLMLQLWNAPADLSMIPIMVQLSQTIPLGGKLEAREKVADAEAAVARANAQVVLRDTEAAVVKAYFDLFSAEQVIVVNAGVRLTMQALRDGALARATGGLGEQVEVLRAQTELVKLEGEDAEAEALRASATAQLVALLDRPAGSAMGTPTTQGFLLALPPEATLREQALRSRPELRAADAAIQGADAQVQLADAAAMPDIAPTVGYMRNFRGEGERNFVFLGVQGNLPIFFGSKINPRREAARAQAQSLRDTVQALRNKVIAEVAQSYAQVRAQQHAIEIHHRLIPLAKQALDSALASYSGGRVNFLMVLDSEREFRMHQLSLAKNLAIYEQRVSELERAVSTDLGLAEHVQTDRPIIHPGETP